MIFGGVDAVMMIGDPRPSRPLRRPGPRRPQSTTPPPTAATAMTIGGGRDTVITDEEYNYLASMADDGLLHVGGRLLMVDEHGCRCRRGCEYDTDAVAAAAAAAAATMIDAQWVVEQRPPLLHPTAADGPSKTIEHGHRRCRRDNYATTTMLWGGDDDHEARICRRRRRVVRAILCHPGDVVRGGVHAIGQIWSSALALDATRMERAEGERVSHTDRARSKARLIDALLVSGGCCDLRHRPRNPRLIPSTSMAPANARGIRQSAKL